MYRPLDRIVGRQYSLANSLRASTTTASAAPQSNARWRTTAMSSPPCPRSIATATTSRPDAFAIQLIPDDVSKPREVAGMKRSDLCPIALLSAELLQFVDPCSQFGA